MKVRDRQYLWMAALFAVFGALILARGKDTDTGLAYLVIAAGQVAVAFLRTPRAVDPDEPLGPGPLARTPSGRFRASGWPPSKDVDDYR